MNVEEHYLPSACYTARNGIHRYLDPRGCVLHYISGKNVYPRNPYDPDRIVTEILIPERLSYHALILRDGTIWRLVPDAYQAWHAGRSRMHGKDYCNAFCYGVAFVSTGSRLRDLPPFSEAQLESAAEYIATALKIRDTNWIKGHDDVRRLWNARYPNQKDVVKHDPGNEFPWEDFYAAINYHSRSGYDHEEFEDDHRDA